MEPHVRPRIGLLPVGHSYYWEQYPRLKAMGERMCGRVEALLRGFAEVVSTELVDSTAKARRAAELLSRERVDMIAIFPLGYTPSMNVIPAVSEATVPIRILNVHEDRSYDYATADTTIYLHHEGVCCVPEIAGSLRSIGKPFRVRTGYTGDPRLLHELRCDALGAAAASAFRTANFGLIGQVYKGMSDMPIDEHRLLRATGKLLARPEVEEIEDAFDRVTPVQTCAMLAQFRETYDIDENVTDEHMRFSARAAVAYNEVIQRYDISAFGYYWWGQKELVRQLRAQSALAVSRLAAMGRPGVTEGDVKSAMAMKVLHLLGGGGMFVEFFAMDFAEEFLLLGHDGPSNIAMSEGRPRLMHLDLHHGKSGHGLGIDFRMAEGPVTLVNLTQVDAGDTFKLICTVGEVIPGPILRIGNPNCRVRVGRPLHEFIDAWCQQAPSHHVALGLGDHRDELETFAEAMGFQMVRV